MHILIITQYFWPENFRINDLASGLVERGNRVTVLTGIPNYPEGHFFPGYGVFKRTREEYKGMSIVRIPVIPRGKGGSLRLIVNYFSYTMSACLLAPFLLRSHFDVIFFTLSPLTEGIPALLLKKIKRVPIMFLVQDLWPESLSATGVVTHSFALKIVEKLMRLLYKGCDRILVQSRSFISPIEGRGADKERIAYFPNYAEELYSPVQVRSDAPERAIIPKGFIVMFAGNIGSAQDFPTILRAAERLKFLTDIQWVIIGDGRMRPWVEAQVRERRLEKCVHLIGRYPLETMPCFFSLADVLLVTLKNEPIFCFTVPGKVLSYMACARPIVAAINGEVTRIIEESSAGIACAAENPEALADSILKMHGMTDTERLKMGQKGRMYFEMNFERNRLIDVLNGWMHEMV